MTYPAYIGGRNRTSSALATPQRDPTALVPQQTFLEEFSAPPAGKVHLLYGEASSVFPLSMALVALAVLRDSHIALVDGGNRFDIHAVTGFAREQGADPDTVLQRVFISRGFTCYQMEATIVGRLPLFLKKINTRV